MDNLLRIEIRDKILKHNDNSYIIISIGDLRELIPELNKLITEEKIKPEPKSVVSSLPKLKDENGIVPLEDLEYHLICMALEKTNGDIKNAASELGVSRRNLYRKLEYHKINHNDYKQ